MVCLFADSECGKHGNCMISWGSLSGRCLHDGYKLGRFTAKDISPQQGLMMNSTTNSTSVMIVPSCRPGELPLALVGLVCGCFVILALLYLIGFGKC